MKSFSFFEKLILLLNSAGFAAYLFWLAVGAGTIFDTQEGVLYVLPCIPFFFVYIYLFAGRTAQDEEELLSNDEADNNTEKKG